MRRRKRTATEAQAEALMRARVIAALNIVAALHVTCPYCSCTFPVEDGTPKVGRPLTPAEQKRAERILRNFTKKE